MRYSNRSDIVWSVTPLPVEVTKIKLLMEEIDDLGCKKRKELNIYYQAAASSQNSHYQPSTINTLIFHQATSSHPQPTSNTYKNPPNFLPPQGTNISHLGKGKIIFKSVLGWDIFVPRRIYFHLAWIQVKMQLRSMRRSATGFWLLMSWEVHFERFLSGGGLGEVISPSVWLWLLGRRIAFYSGHFITNNACWRASPQIITMYMVALFHSSNIGN